MVQFQEWKPSFANARSIEFVTILGPMFSRPTTFPDGDPDLVLNYFGSNGGIADDLFDYERGSIGDRNMGNVRSSQTSLQNAAVIAQVALIYKEWLERLGVYNH
jgi:ubiquitin conjugation factor E4 B